MLKALRESLIAHGITAVRGILNGTCNYILTQMESTGRPFADMLADAQKLGYAEADPTLDVGGGDTAHKLALLSSLAFGVKPDLSNIAVTGITDIASEDIKFARELGYRIKLLGIAKMTPRGLDQRVQAAMVKLGTPLADVDSSFNAVVAQAGAAGPFFFEGRGAGEAPTAGAVIADLADVARGECGPAFGRPARMLKHAVPAPPEARVSPSLPALPGARCPRGTCWPTSPRHLTEAGVSIESMIQRGRAPGEPVAIVMVTHECAQPLVARALKAIAASDKVLGTPSMIPMEAG